MRDEWYCVYLIFGRWLGFLLLVRKGYCKQNGTSTSWIIQPPWLSTATFPKLFFKTSISSEIWTSTCHSSKHKRDGQTVTRRFQSQWPPVLPSPKPIMGIMATRWKRTTWSGHFRWLFSYTVISIHNTKSASYYILMWNAQCWILWQNPANLPILTGVSQARDGPRHIFTIPLWDTINQRLLHFGSWLFELLVCRMY